MAVSILLVLATFASDAAVPIAPAVSEHFAPDGLQIVLPVEPSSCALEIRAEGDAADAPPTKIKIFERGLIRIEQQLAEGEVQQKPEMLIQLDDGWFAQGRPSLYRVASPDNDPAKVSPPHRAFLVEGSFLFGLARAKSMRLWEDRIEQMHFDLRKIGSAPMDAWTECLKALGVNPLAAEASSTHYRPQTPLQPLTPISKDGWLTGDDYPARALRSELQGTVAFTLEVGVNGRVRGCSMTENTTPTIIPSVNDVPDLNAATCRIITRRARFLPATDGSGRPFVSYWSGRVKWVLAPD